MPALAPAGPTALTIEAPPTPESTPLAARLLPCQAARFKKASGKRATPVTKAPLLRPHGTFSAENVVAKPAPALGALALAVGLAREAIIYRAVIAYRAGFTKMAFGSDAA